MKNVEFTVTKEKIVITIDRGYKEWASGSGKSMMLASTEGNVAVDGTDYTVGLNCYRKNKK